MATGRRRKLTPEKIEEICKWISEGQTINVAAGLSCVSLRSVMGWLEQGRNAEVADEQGEELTEMQSLCLQFCTNTKRRMLNGRKTLLKPSESQKLIRATGLPR